MCQACGSFGIEHQWAHYVGRSNSSVRWDLDNGITLCDTCHKLMDSNHATKFKDFMIRHLGDDRYYSLMARSREYFKESEENLKEALEKLRNGAESYVG